MFKQAIIRESFEIETQRLVLIPITLEYAQDIFTEFDEEITKYMFPIPAKDISETNNFIISSIEKNTSWTNIQLVIIDKNSKEFIGCVWLHAAETDCPELWIRVKKSAHGKRYWFEAVEWLKKRADKNMIFDYLYYPVDHRNIWSCKIPERLWWITDWIITLKESADPNKILESITYKIYSK